MIIPINGHVVVEPVVHESFISSQKETYDEIGTVMAIYESDAQYQPKFNIGDRVYFDSWLAARYPKNDTEYYWLVKVDDIRAYEQIPKE